MIYLFKQPSMTVIIFLLVIQLALVLSGTVCVEDGDDGSSYRGDVAVTVSGRVCQRWDSQSPNEHDVTPERYPNAGLNDNYCRNPDGEPSPWCYNAEGTSPRWELCDVAKCGEIECWNNDDRDAKGSGYKGTQSVTKGGFTCQKWTEQSPQQHGFDPDAYGDKGVGDHNYCRNPQEKHDETWCYTTSPDKRWDWCEVPSCDADTTGPDQIKFSDFNLKESIYSSTHIRQDMTTNMKLEVSSSFYIHALFTGNYDRGCGFTFNIMDNNNVKQENMFHLDFRLNNKNRYRKLVQSSKFNKKWGYMGESTTDLPDLARETDIYLTVTDEFYEVTINNIEITPKFKIDLSRLHTYKGINVKYYGECLRFDKDKSYMRKGGGKFQFSLINEENKRIQLGQNSGLLLANRAGSSKNGTVCGEKFSDKSATLICQELGFRGSNSWETGLNWPDVQSNYDTILHEVVCDGNNSMVEECAYGTDQTSSTCIRQQNVFLSCISNNDTCKIAKHNKFLKWVCTDYKGNQYFKCLESDTYYNIEAALPGWSKFSKLCENDPNFYQVCGAGHKEKLGGGQIDVLCGYYICEEETGIFSSGYKADTSYSCDGEQQCSNTNLDEADCEGNSSVTIPSSKLCDGYCDLIYCEDESWCNNHTYGVHCGDKYHPPLLVGFDVTIYNASLNNATSCAKDNKSKTNLHKCNYSNNELIGIELLGELKPDYEVYLNTVTRCGSFKYRQPAIDKAFWINSEYSPYCKNYWDQTNCTDPSKVALTCTVNGYPATISKQMLCHGIEGMMLCSDGIENECIDLSPTCSNLHKHKMCDNVTDCSDRSDEENIMCRQLTEQPCIRRLNGKSLKIPLAWLQDGTSDCQNGIDETDIWPTCGEDDTFRFVSDKSSCLDDYRCLNSNIKFIGMEELCDGIDTCGNENSVCKFSRGTPDLYTKISHTGSNIIDLSYCVNGLRSLEKLAPNCESMTFGYPRGKVFGLIEKKLMHIPANSFDCKYLYGELYLYMSCSDKCGNHAPCPLTRPVLHDSCPGQYLDRTYTVVNNNYLTFLVKSQGSYNNDLFVCENNHCLPYQKVCDLVDDCGDGSDELSCTNHFQCGGKGSFIAKTQQCDGIFDCVDLSDECNDRCGKHIIEGKILKGMSWTIGVLAVVFNSVVVIQNLISIKKCSSVLSLLNKFLIMLISLGDLLVGGYLLTISIVDYIEDDRYCHNQKIWLTSKACSLLGVISTLGSQFSLFSMTLLSIVRMYGVKNSLGLGSGLSKIGVIRNISIIFAVILVSMAIAVVPLQPSFADFFVNGLSYDSSISLFAGFPDKSQHKNVLTAYYGRMKDRYLSWEVIIDLMKAMFTHKYDGLQYKKVDFYGNDGVCLFKYFVSSDDPQKDYVWAVLAINFLCFTVISTSYFVIGLISTNSSRMLTVGHANKMVSDRNKKMNRKIAVIIFTDFCCWVPFIIICALHTLGVIDASPWYGLFSIVVLPINSVINPLLYDNTLSLKIGRTFNTIRGSSNAFISRITRITSDTQSDPGLGNQEMGRVTGSEQQCTDAIQSRGRHQCVGAADKDGINSIVADTGV